MSKPWSTIPLMEVDRVGVGSTLWFRHDRALRLEFQSVEITGETRGTWTFGEGWTASSVNKKTLAEPQKAGGRQFYTDAGMDAYLWCLRNQSEIEAVLGKPVRNEAEYRRLRLVASILQICEFGVRDDVDVLQGLANGILAKTPGVK